MEFECKYSIEARIDVASKLMPISLSTSAGLELKNAFHVGRNAYVLCRRSKYKSPGRHPELFLRDVDISEITSVVFDLDNRAKGNIVRGRVDQLGVEGLNEPPKARQVSDLVVNDGGHNSAFGV